MKYTINSMFGWGMAIMLIAGVFTFVPAYAHAFDFGQIIDPACFFACDNDDGPRNVTKNITYTNSNNHNSNINSPGGTVISGDARVYGYNTTPVYSYNYPTYPTYPQQSQPLQASCYPMPLSARTGDTVQWYASAYGGNGSFNYSWTGTDGLSGYGQGISKVYHSPGYKNATVTVISGNQTVSRNCDGTTYVTGDTYNNYPPPTYNYPTISLSCSVNTAFAPVGSTVTWSAYASGGAGTYSYSWTGTDGLYGSGQSRSYSYNSPGQKYASVTVYSGGQTITQSCGNSVNVGAPIANPYPPPIYGVPPSMNMLDIGCFADPSSTRIDQPVTWSAEVTGGFAPYTYSWSGSNSLSGTQSSVTKYYGTTGEKNAIVTITSADGKTGTRACSNTVTVRGAVSTGGTTPPPQQPPATTSPLSVASIYSPENGPRGWVAVLVILVLFATVLYLLFNRQKI